MAHYYLPTGEAAHFVPKKSGGGTRPTTIADARKLKLLPGVTTILNLLDKPGLNAWKVHEAVVAVVTAPDLPGETIDQKLVRVLETESQQDEEARKARDVGAQIHAAIELALNTKEWDQSLAAFVNPVLEWVKSSGRVVWTEKVLVGDRFAGKADLLLEHDLMLLLTDFKTAKKLPQKDSWPEHKLQTAAYASCLGNTNGKPLVTCNLYISTTRPGDFIPFTQVDWPETYRKGFLPLVEHWQWANKYWIGGES